MEKSADLTKDFSISRIVTGLWQVADMERNGKLLDPDKTSKYLEEYVAKGLTSFDLADHYGSSEIIVGKHKSKSDNPETTQVFTKWVPEPGKISEQDVLKAIELSSKRLEGAPIDIFQFHAWQYANPSWLDALSYLNKFREQGLIRNIGVTNFDAAHLRIALSYGIPIVSNQICHSLIDQRASNHMFSLCQDYEIKILAFGTLAGGFLTDKWVGKKEPSQGELKTWSEMKYKRFIDEAGGWEQFQNLLETLSKIAQKHNVSVANISGNAILRNEHVAAIIIGARIGESNHIKDNLKIFEINLDNEDIQSIKKAQNEMSAIPGNCGDEYRKPPFLTASGDLSHHLNNFPPIFESVPVSQDRTQVFSGTVWEDIAGFSRAVRDGNRIYVSGTTATHRNEVVGMSDPYVQTHFIIDKIEAALNSLGSKIDDIVRTRIFVKDISDWEASARAHGERFQNINPANTLVEARLVGDEYLVEIEAEAVIN